MFELAYWDYFDPSFCGGSLYILEKALLGTASKWQMPGIAGQLTSDHSSHLFSAGVFTLKGYSIGKVRRIFYFSHGGTQRDGYVGKILASR